MQLLNPNRDLDFSVRDVNIDFFKSLFDQRFRIMASNGYRKNSSTNDSAEKSGFVSSPSIPMDERCHENRQ